MTAKLNITQALAYAADELATLESELIDSSVDARFLLCSCLEVQRSYLMTWPERELSLKQCELFQAMVERRKCGEPVAYIIGNQGFWDLDLLVNPDTLIPRADTEVLVELALEKATPTSRILDLGTGTGAIALALAKELVQSTVVGVDYFANVVELAKSNAIRNQVSNISFFQSDWFSAIDRLEQSHFDLIVSNPPYIDEQDPHLSQGDVRFEPSSALSAANQGFADLELIILRSRSHLNEGGWLMLEHGYDQSEQVLSCLREAGYIHTRNHLDYGGNPRVSVGQFFTEG